MGKFIVIFLLILCNCSKPIPQKTKQILRINIEADPATLDPRRARDNVTITLMHMLYEGLTRKSIAGTLEMALLRDYDVSEDGKRYRFHLRNSMWSNGTPVTSYDFAESWKTTLKPDFPTDMAYQLFVIKNGRKAKLGEVGTEDVGIETPDSETLLVELEQPTPYFLELLTMPSFFPVPKDTALNSGVVPDIHTNVSNGPFYIESFKHSDSVHVKKNQNYWENEKVKLDEIIMLRMPVDTEMKMFEENLLDWAGSPLSSIPPDAVPYLKECSQLKSSPFSATFFFRTNTVVTINGKRNPLSNCSFRKALGYAIDRKAIVEHVLQGGERPAMGLVPIEMGISLRGYFEDKDLNKARLFLKQALDELNLNLENLEPITISYSSGARSNAIIQAVQKQWEDELGISVLLEAVESKVYFKRISQKEFQIAGASWIADFDDPINFLEVFKFKEGSTNNTGWENSKYVDLLNKSALCRDSTERKKFLQEAEEVLMDDMPILPVYYYSLNYLQNKELDQVVLSPQGQIDFRWAHFSNKSSL